MEILKLEIAKLEMKPGDTLVIRTRIWDALLDNPDGLDALHECVPEGCRALLLPMESELSIITPKET